MPQRIQAATMWTGSSFADPTSLRHCASHAIEAPRRCLRRLGRLDQAGVEEGQGAALGTRLQAAAVEQLDPVLLPELSA